MTRTISILTAFASMLAALIAAEPERQIIPAKAQGRVVDASVMQKIYDEAKSPFKYGDVLKGEGTNKLVDCASVFR